MPSNPLVSVGLPVYNGEETIDRAIKSLMEQTYSNLEIIVSDNGSTDDTREILKKYQQFDPRIKVFHSDVNRGSSWNFNKVFRESTGDYFMWASHDDQHDLKFVASCVQAMEQEKRAALCAPNMQMTAAGSNKVVWISSMDSFKDKNSLKERYRETLRNFPAVSIYGLYRRSLLEKTGLFPKVMGGDLLMIQELSFFGPFIGLPEILFTRRGRLKWNSIDQDYMTFFGRPKKPFWYSPFIVLFLSQILQLLHAKLSLNQRFSLIAILFRYQIEQFGLKLSIKVLKYLLHKRLRLPVAKLIYWKFMNGPNIKAVNSEIFTERIVKPRLGWFN
jgi:glycosyltransferase involved in cell wall biosynthesis